MDSHNSAPDPPDRPGAPDEATLLRLLADAAREFAIFATDLRGVILTWNPGVHNITGYAEQEFVGNNCDMLFTPEDREAGAPEREREVARRDGQALNERWHLRKDGSRFWGSGYMHALYDGAGELKGFAKILRDMTERKRRDEELEARVRERTAAHQELQRRLLTAQEDERRRVSREMHDQTGQHLVAVGIELGLLEKTAAAARVAADTARTAREAADEAAKAGALPEAGRLARTASEAARTAALAGTDARAAAAEADAAMATVDEAAPRLSRLQSLTASLSRDIHRLAVELRPTALDDIGLPGALQSLVEQWSEHHRAAVGLSTEFQAVGFAPGLGRMPQEVETTIYRVVQEAPTNVRKHALPGGATRVSVLLHRRDSVEVLANVEDDGPGFDVEVALASGRLGLAGMRERAELVGGTLEVDSAPGEDGGGGGTTIYLRVPLPPPPPGEPAERSETG